MSFPNNLALTKMTAGLDGPTFLGSQAEISILKIGFSIPSDDGCLFFYQQCDLIFPSQSSIYLTEQQGRLILSLCISN